LPFRLWAGGRCYSIVDINGRHKKNGGPWAASFLFKFFRPVFRQARPVARVATSDLRGTGPRMSNTLLPTKVHQTSTTRSLGSMPAQLNTSRPFAGASQGHLVLGPLPYFLSSAIASSNASQSTTAAKSLRARFALSLLKACHQRNLSSRSSFLLFLASFI